MDGMSDVSIRKRLQITFPQLYEMKRNIRRQENRTNDYLLYAIPQSDAAALIPEIKGNRQSSGTEKQ